MKKYRFFFSILVLVTLTACGTRKELPVSAPVSEKQPLHVPQTGSTPLVPSPPVPLETEIPTETEAEPEPTALELPAQRETTRETEAQTNSNNDENNTLPSVASDSPSLPAKVGQAIGAETGRYMVRQVIGQVGGAVGRGLGEGMGQVIASYTGVDFSEFLGLAGQLYGAELARGSELGQKSHKVGIRLGAKIGSKIGSAVSSGFSKFRNLFRKSKKLTSAEKLLHWGDRFIDEQPEPHSEPVQAFQLFFEILQPWDDMDDDQLAARRAIQERLTQLIDEITHETVSQNWEPVIELAAQFHDFITDDTLATAAQTQESNKAKLVLEALLHSAPQMGPLPESSVSR